MDSNVQTSHRLQIRLGPSLSKELLQAKPLHRPAWGCKRHWARSAATQNLWRSQDQSRHGFYFSQWGMDANLSRCSTDPHYLIGKRNRYDVHEIVGRSRSLSRVGRSSVDQERPARVPQRIGQRAGSWKMFEPFALRKIGGSGVKGDPRRRSINPNFTTSRIMGM
jgi:hypothetical protein